MARYVKYARQVAKEEFEKLKVSAGERKVMRRLVVQGESAVAPTIMSPAVRERFAQMLNDSERLKKIQGMRVELEALWSKSAATHEQLLKQLQDWVARAEASGIRQLEDFSMNLRRYAV
jgi:stearoyl-CoA desaturase (delta-9 desaturase)